MMSKAIQKAFSETLMEQIIIIDGYLAAYPEVSHESVAIMLQSSISCISVAFYPSLVIPNEARAQVMDSLCKHLFRTLDRNDFAPHIRSMFKDEDSLYDVLVPMLEKIEAARV